MWKYDFITRNEFEERKNFVANTLLNLGCEVINITLPYKQKTTSYCLDNSETYISTRPIYKYQNEYYRIDEALFNIPYIVLECTDNINDIMENTMEDSDPLPYNLSDSSIIDEIKFILGINL